MKGGIVDTGLLVTAINAISTGMDHEPNPKKRLRYAKETEKIFELLVQNRNVLQSSSNSNNSTINARFDAPNDDTVQSMLQVEQLDSEGYDNITSTSTHTEQYSGVSEMDVTMTNDVTSSFDGMLAAYNACLDTWSKAYVRESAPKCESLLQRFLTKMNNEDGNSTDSIIKPNTTSFNSCMYGTYHAT
jgi:hypothetical protein